MREYRITEDDSGRRLDKFAGRILSEAPSSFVYKMLRKKNIELNDRKATGSEILTAGDTVKFYLSDETMTKFSKSLSKDQSLSGRMPPIVYEGDDLIIVNKPSGMLSQKSQAGDISLNEICLSYISFDPSGQTFTPSVCNRLDRNTSGLITFAKTYKGSRAVAEALRSRTVHKYYTAVVRGVIKEDTDLKGSLVKNEKTNTVTVYDDDKGSYINTKVHPITTNGDISIVEILLVTGKTHQIRAHLAHIGHPIIGDMKYGDRDLNMTFKKLGIDSQMLACTKMVFPKGFDIPDLSGRTVSINPPDEYEKVMKWQRGTQEV